MVNNGFDPKDIEDFCDRQKRKRVSAQTSKIDFVARDKEKVAWTPELPATEINNLPPAKVDRGFLWGILEAAVSVFDAVGNSCLESLGNNSNDSSRSKARKESWEQFDAEQKARDDAWNKTWQDLEEERTQQQNQNYC
jgi:hypothetical protein